MEENLWSLFEKGGVFMWPILGLSVVAGCIIVERLLFYSVRRYRVGKSLEVIRGMVGGQPAGKSGNPLLQVASSYLGGLGEGAEHVRNVTERTASRILNGYERGLGILGLIGTVSPLVGLLGTVWGMVQAFAQISTLAEEVRPADLAGGIWTGLLTTVAGLVVAIPAVCFSRMFESKADKLTHDVNEVVSHLDEWTGRKG
jgi:biopolymer transport protein ExbB